jgi:hypothetical protein
MTRERWAILSADGEWVRDEAGRVLTFLVEQSGREHLAALLQADPDGGWTLEQFTVEDALEEATRSPFATEGGL